jgi:NADH:ubiquinone oxidoreductase subunit F (NADH-binding)
MQQAAFPLLVAETPASIRAQLTLNAGTCGLATGARELLAALRASAGDRPEIIEAGCDGACFEAPSATLRDAAGSLHRRPRLDAADLASLLRESDSGPSAGEVTPAPAGAEFFALQKRSLLANVGAINPLELDSALERGAYRGLWRALTQFSPEQVVDEVEASHLRGRGGAYFPTGLKWRSAREFAGPRYLVVNAEEGEPGVFKDRHLLEGDPHLLLEGLLIAAYAVGASRGFIYVNGLAHGSRQTLRRAIEQARSRALLGEHVLGSDLSFDLELRAGAGGYVLGEESVLLNSIEGERSVPRTRPPFPTQAGLWASPTVINNVETLCNVPFILREGAERFREGEGECGAGTKLVSLSGVVRRPGLVEVAMGTTIREIVFAIGGGAPDGRRVIGVLCGGPSGGFLAVDSLDTPARPGALHGSGAVLGSGGLVVLDQSLSIPEVVRHLTAYNRNESCGKCTPCREGTDRMLAILDRAVNGEATPADLEQLLFLGEVATSASLCGLGQMASNPITSAVNQFEPEFRAAFNPS